MNVEEIMSLMEDINYGWVDKNGLIHNEVDDNFASLYMLQSPKEILNSKVGVCWDQVELERYYFKNTRLNIKTSLSMKKTITITGLNIRGKFLKAFINILLKKIYFEMLKINLLNMSYIISMIKIIYLSMNILNHGNI